MPSIHFRRSAGVVFTETGLVATIAARTPFGLREVDTIELDGLGRADALRSVQERVGKRGHVVVGLDAREVVFRTRRAAADDETEDDELPDHLRAAARAPGGFVLSGVTHRVRGQRFRSVVGCLRTVVERTMEDLGSAPDRRVRLEPEPWAIFRLAGRATPAPRRWGTHVRLVADGDRALAVLACRGVAVAWRMFHPCAVPARSVVLGLADHARAALGLPGLDGVLAHGLEADTEGLAIETRAAPPVSIDATSVSLGLALGGLRADADAPDLLHEVRPPLPVREIFPWGTAALLALVAAGSGWMLQDEADLLESRAWGARLKATASLEATGTDLADIESRHEEIVAEIEIAHAFIADRVAWAPLLRDLAERVPDGVVLSALNGRDTLSLPEEDGPAGLKAREISLAAAMVTASDEPVPPRVRGLAEALAESELLQEAFPFVKSSNLQRDADTAGDVLRLSVRYARNP